MQAVCDETELIISNVKYLNRCSIFCVSVKNHTLSDRHKLLCIFILSFVQKSEPSRDDRGSVAMSGAASAGGMMSPSSSTHDDLSTSLAVERQQHGALPDLLPPQIPPRASMPDKTVSDEVY